MNPIRCLPLEEKQHSNSFKQLGVLYYSVLNEKNNPKNTANELPAMKLEEKNGNEHNILGKNKEEEKNDSICLCDHKSHIEEKFFWEQENNEINEEAELIGKEKQEICIQEKSDPQLEDFFSLLTSKKENNFSDHFSEINANAKHSFDLSQFCLLCEKKKENEKHKHGPGCGHSIINHQGHIDYIVEGILHYPHEEHCDDHGKIIFK